MVVMFFTFRVIMEGCSCSTPSGTPYLHSSNRGRSVAQIRWVIRNDELAAIEADSNGWKTQFSVTPQHSTLNTIPICRYHYEIDQ